MLHAVRSRLSIRGRKPHVQDEHMVDVRIGQALFCITVRHSERRRYNPPLILLDQPVKQDLVGLERSVFVLDYQRMKLPGIAHEDSLGGFTTGKDNSILYSPETGTRRAVPRSL